MAQPIQNNTNFSGNNNPLFTLNSKTIDFLGVGSREILYASPKTASINIKDDFMWKNSGDASEVPCISVVERALKFGTTLANILRLYENFKDFLSSGKLDPYQELYIADETGFRYIFPRLLKDGSNLKDITNRYMASKGITNDNTFEGGDLTKKLSSLSNILGFATSLTLGSVSPGIAMETIMEYESTENRLINIQFPLYNTISLESAFKNYSFITLFAFQNLKTRTSFLTFEPPKIYEISSFGGDGGLYSPVCIVQNFAVNSIGTTRLIDDLSGLSGGAKIEIPEAYHVSITFQELLPQTTNIMLGSMGGSKVSSSIYGGQTVAEDINRVKNAVGDVVKIGQDVLNGKDKSNTNGQ
jgi:hypothetical protein